ncbi:MAG: peptide chain release factor 1 [Alphaproteobacteria bacterium]|nr:peptide chain release factor 1 [Alphaproteobacteria bacterium]MBT7941868.1 peptide chain release factor 1 [Alphaproteobacteria bacterium]
MSLEENLDRVLSRHQELEALMSSSSPPAAEDFAKLSKEYSDLTPVVEAISGLRDAKQEIGDLAAMIADGETDSEMKEMAVEEFADLKAKIPDLEKRLQVMLLPKDAADSKNAILEVRAGTGGEEAGLFAADLFRMYQRYAENQRWKFEIMSLSETGVGGYKEAFAVISGTGVFAKLKFESGVHRVQRVPSTESSGRIHTSAATVAVMPEAEEVDIQIEEKDLRIDVFRASGPGGQSVNTTDSAVRITHIPTGVVVSQQDEKSQHKNKAKAMRVLRSRIYEAERQKAADARAETRKAQVGSGDRSERIRTYNFPERRVTDHRVNLTIHKLDAVINGDLDEIIETLTTDDESRRLAEIE